jgi:hypothetical protein
LEAATYNLTLAYTAGQENAAATGDLDLTGAGHTITFVGKGAATVIDAHQLDRVFQVFPGVQVIFRNLTITGGLAQDDGTAGAAPGTTFALGGGILNQGGSVTLDHAVVKGNAAQRGNGEPAEGGGIYSAGSLAVANHSAVMNNQATGGTGFNGFGANGADGSSPGANGTDGGAGGGGTGGFAKGGGIFADGGPLIVSGSVIAMNACTGGDGGTGFGGNGGAGNGGGNGGNAGDGVGGAGGLGLGGGIFATGSAVLLTRATVSGNTATGGNGGPGIGGRGGAGGPSLLHDGHSGYGGLGSVRSFSYGLGFGEGGGIFLSGSTARIVASVISGNHSEGGRGGYCYGGDGGNGGDGAGALDPTIRGDGGNGGDGEGGAGGYSIGGGIVLTLGTQLTLSRTAVSGNSCTGGAGGVGAGGNGGSGGQGDPGFSGGVGGSGGFGEGVIGALAQGGGIYADVGTALTLTDRTTVSGNTSTGGNGGNGFGGNGGNGGNGGTGGSGGPAGLGDTATGGPGGLGQEGGVFAEDALLIAKKYSRIIGNSTANGAAGSSNPGLAGSAGANG